MLQSCHGSNDPESVKIIRMWANKPKDILIAQEAAAKDIYEVILKAVKLYSGHTNLKLIIEKNVDHIGGLSGL